MCTVKKLCPQAPKGAQKAPNWSNGTYENELFIHPSDLFEILLKCGDSCYEHKSITADPRKLWFVSPGTLSATNTH